MDQNNQFQNPVNSTPSTMPYSPKPMGEKPSETVIPMGAPSKKVGPIVATLVVVLVVIIAALYFIALNVGSNSTPQVDMTNNTSANPFEAQAVKPVTNTSDDVQSIANDLNDATAGLDGQTF